MVGSKDILWAGVVLLACAPTGSAEAFEDPVARQTSATIGVYLTVPLGGGPSARSQAPFHYGFAVQTDLAYRSLTGATVGGARYRVDALDVRFGAHGFEALSSGGYHWLRRGDALPLQAKDEGSDKWVLVGVGAAAIGLGLALAGGGDDCASGTSKDDGTCLPPVSF